jgi:hypothetical protein
MTSLKDQAIVDLLSRLSLDNRNWLVVDYWEADLCAIGVRSRFDSGRLVYVSTYRKRPGLFYYECEGPASGEAPYTTIETGKDASFEELLEVMSRHLTDTGTDLKK